MSGISETKKSKNVPAIKWGDKLPFSRSKSELENRIKAVQAGSIPRNVAII